MTYVLTYIYAGQRGFYRYLRGFVTAQEDVSCFGLFRGGGGRGALTEAKSAKNGLWPAEIYGRRKWWRMSPRWRNYRHHFVNRLLTKCWRNTFIWRFHGRVAVWILTYFGVSDFSKKLLHVAVKRNRRNLDTYVNACCQNTGYLKYSYFSIRFSMTAARRGGAAELSLHV